MRTLREDCNVDIVGRVQVLNSDTCNGETYWCVSDGKYSSFQVQIKGEDNIIINNKAKDNNSIIEILGGYLKKGFILNITQFSVLSEGCVTRVEEDEQTVLNEEFYKNAISRKKIWVKGKFNEKHPEYYNSPVSKGGEKSS